MNHHQESPTNSQVAEWMQILRDDGQIEFATRPPRAGYPRAIALVLCGGLLVSLAQKSPSEWGVSNVVTFGVLAFGAVALCLFSKRLSRIGTIPSVVTNEGLSGPHGPAVPWHRVLAFYRTRSTNSRGISVVVSEDDFRQMIAGKTGPDRWYAIARSCLVGPGRRRVLWLDHPQAMPVDITDFLDQELAARSHSRSAGRS